MRESGNTMGWESRDDFYREESPKVIPLIGSCNKSAGKVFIQSDSPGRLMEKIGRYVSRKIGIPM